MRKTALFLLFSATISLSAQHNLYVPPARDSVIAGTCPIDFSARINGRAIARAANDDRKNPGAPLLELTFSHRETPKIQSASVTVHGLYATGRFMPVDSRTDNPRADRIQSFTLEKDANAPELTFHEVSVDKMALVQWAEITELRYVDGTAWHPSSYATCRAAPSLYHLVDLEAR